MVRRTLIALLTISALAFAPQARAFQAVEPPEGYVQEVRSVARGVWLLTQPRFQVQPAGNVTLIEQSDGLVLVDAGGSPGAARRVIGEVRRLSDKPVKAVVITHWHGDHAQGLAEILKAWPRAKTIATRATQAHLRDPATMNTPASPDAAADAEFQKQIAEFATYARRMASDAAHPREQAGWSASERLFVRYGRDMAGATTLSTGEGFDDRFDITDPDSPVEVRFLGRANTDGDAVVWLPSQKVLITGDVVVSPFPFGFGSYPADWLETLDRLKAYRFRTLIPGHGPPQHDRAYIERLAAAIADVRRQVGQQPQGASFDEVRTRFDATGHLRGFAGDDPWLQRWVKDYWIAPILRSAFKEARGEPIVQSLKGD